MNCIPDRLLEDFAQERIDERRRAAARRYPLPSPRTPMTRGRTARALRRLADRLEPGG